MRIAILLLVGTIGLCLFLMKDFQREIRKLEITISNLEEKKKIYEKNKAWVCDIEDGDLVYLDCGEAFVPRYATCFCTKICLADYSATYTNSAPADCAHNPYKQ